MKEYLFITQTLYWTGMLTILESHKVDRVCLSFSDTALPIHKHLICYRVLYCLNPLIHISKYLHCFFRFTHSGLLSPVFVSLVRRAEMLLYKQFEMYNISVNFGVLNLKWSATMLVIMAWKPCADSRHKIIIILIPKFILFENSWSLEECRYTHTGQFASHRECHSACGAVWTPLSCSHPQDH